MSLLLEQKFLSPMSTFCHPHATAFAFLFGGKANSFVLFVVSFHMILSTSFLLFLVYLSHRYLSVSNFSKSTPCLIKTVQICFCQNFVKFPPSLITFGRQMANRLKLCALHSFSTSPTCISRHHTTVLHADVPNC